ncbi:MAG: hypothetical protein FIA98_16900 [Anaerolineae bacterium]|nr:hypothetical protein [Anaerolineae bacterium]
MSRTSQFSQMLRIAFVLLFMFTFAIQPSSVGSAQTPGDEPPVDLTEPGPTPVIEDAAPSTWPTASGPEDMHDYSILDENGQPYLPPAIPEVSAEPGAVYTVTTQLTTDGSLDSTLPVAPDLAAIPYAVTPDEALLSVPEVLDPALDASLTTAGEIYQNPDEVNLPASTPGNLDDFNRPNGSLGASWSPVNGTISIASNRAQTTSGYTTTALAVYSGIGVNNMEADISTQGTTVQYSALVLNYGAGVNNLFIKIQDNSHDGRFDTGGCYLGNNGAGFGLGFFGLSSSFTSAHLSVKVSAARVVTIKLSHIDGGTGTQTYVCSGAPAFEGSSVGIGSYGGGRIDNLSTSPATPVSKDNFNIQNGPLGANWRMRLGSMMIKGSKAVSSTFANNVALYNGLGSNRVEADISLTPGGGLQYAALMLNYDEGVDNLFIKFQDNDGNGNFEKLGCYRGNNSGSFDGFRDVTPFISAHMKIDVGATRLVSVWLTKIDGGTDSAHYLCNTAPGPEGYGVGMASYGGGRVDNFQVINNFEDNFSRANGPLGSNWVIRDGEFTIVNGVAQGYNVLALATYNGLATSEIEGDISLKPGGGVQYTGFVLNYQAGVTDLFLKAQDNVGNGQFTHFGCYIGNNGGPFGPGFFSLSSPFTTAHLHVSVNPARVVTIVLSRINGGAGVQVYTCAGAPVAEGDLAGIVGYGGGQMDNVRINRTVLLDQFNHVDGPLGPTWSYRAANYTVVNQIAVGSLGITDAAITSFNSVTAKVMEGDISLTPGGGTQYSGFTLNYDPGSDFIFVKIQDNDGNGTFDSGACYQHNNASPFGLGFFGLSGVFVNAHLRVSVDVNNNVTILLTKINGGTGTQVYTCTGAPVARDTGIGMDGYNGGRIDNVQVSRYQWGEPAFLPWSRK